MGTVSGAGLYDNGDSATLTATANNGYAFIDWQDGNTDNPRTITVSQDATYTANFGPVYGFTSYDSNHEELATGTVVVLSEDEENEKTTVKVLTNNPNPEFIGMIFIVHTTIATYEGGELALYTSEDVDTGMTVALDID